MKRLERVAYWQAHVDRWRDSGVSGRAYAEDAGISLAMFYKWRRRLWSPSKDLVPVETSSGSGAVRIVVGVDAEIVVDAHSSPEAVRVALTGLGL